MDVHHGITGTKTHSHSHTSRQFCFGITLDGLYMWADATQASIGRTSQPRRAPGLRSNSQPSCCETTLLSAAPPPLFPFLTRSLLWRRAEHKHNLTHLLHHFCSLFFFPCCCSRRAAFAHRVLRRSAPISNLSFPGAVVHCYSYLSAGDFSTSPTTCITAGSGVLRLPRPIAAPPSPHYVV